MGTWDDTELSVVWRPDDSRAAKSKEEKEREKEWAKDDPKGPEEHSLAMSRYKIPQKRTLLGSKGKKGQKGLSKGNDGFQKGGFRTYQPDKGAGKDFHQNKGRGKDQKEKAKKEPPQSGSASETPNEEGNRPGLGIRRLVCQSLD